MNISTRMRGSWYAGTDSIADAIDEGTVFFCQLHGGQRISRFAALRDGYNDIIFIDDRVSVSKFGRIFHFDRNAAKTFNNLLSDESGVP